MFKLLVIFGTRPEAIKLAPIIFKLKQIKNIQVITVNTGQHQELIEAVIRVFALQINHSLHIMHPDQTLSTLTNRLVTKLSSLLEIEKPNLIMVQGDTTTAFVSSLIAYYQHIPIAHVEAGLRSFNKFHPFPEEFNRQAIGVLADWHFAPREENASHLLLQGCLPNQVFVVGNTIVDAIMHILKSKKIRQKHSPDLQYFQSLSKTHKIVLITSHRRENFGAPLRNICEGILELAKMNKDVYFLFCVHLNPNVQEIVYNLLSEQWNILLRPSFDYADFVLLMSYANCILTDSGGIQEEASVLGKPILVLRETTERQEGVRAGIAKLVGSNSESIIREVNMLLNDPQVYKNMVNPQTKFIYGDGMAASKIVEILSKVYSLGDGNFG